MKVPGTSTIFAILSYTFSLVAFIFWPYFQGSGWMFFSKMDTLGYFFLALGAFCMNPRSVILQLTVVALIARLADEFFFDPLKQEAKEFWLMGMLFACVITYNISYYYTNKKK